MIMGFLLVTAVLVVSLGRLGDMYGRVRCTTSASRLHRRLDPAVARPLDHRGGGALWLIGWRVVQGVGGAMLFANSTAILTDAFPPNQRGLALGINRSPAIAGSFIGLVSAACCADRLAAGLLGQRADRPVRHRLGLPSLHDSGARRRPDRLVGQPHLRRRPDRGAARRHHLRHPALRRHTMGWTNPWVLAGLIGGVALLVAVLRDRDRVADPMFDLSLFRIRAVRGRQPRRPARLDGPRRPAVHADHLAAGHLAAAARLRLRDPLWAGIYLLPLTVGFLSPGRSPAGCPTVRRAAVRHRRHAAHRAVSFVCCCCCRSTSLLGVRAADLLLNGSDRAVRRAQHRRRS
jgi:MFS family permease